MKQLGFKNLLLISTLTLVSLSVAVAGIVSYQNEARTLTKIIVDSTQSFVTSSAKKVELVVGDKVGAVGKIASLYKSTPIEGSREELIQMTHIMAAAANLNSAVVAFENGDGYWNQEANTWPNHKYEGDVTTRGWYQAARQANGTSVTDPYLGSEGDVYWISIVEKTLSGMVSVDMKLGFLNELAKAATEIPGSVAVIMAQDTSILASSSLELKVGEKGSNITSLQQVFQKAVGDERALQEYQLDGVEKLMFSQQIKAGDKHWYFVLSLDKAIAFSDLSAAKSEALWVGIIACVVSVIAAYFIIQLLYTPIIQLKKTILDLAQGDADLTQRLNVESNDDLGQIAQGVNGFVENLQQMMNQIQQAGEVLQQNVVRLQDNSSRNSSILQSHVQETEQVVTAIEEMNATAESMAADAASTAQLTQKANQASEASRGTVSGAQNSVTALVEDVQETAGSVQKLSDETDSINQILNVIGDIAEQTNLLALNAAIEAARAGEQGRGFAVVADEVRMLATRTKESTEEIESALGSLLKGNQQVVRAMDTTKGRCESTAEAMGAVAQSLGAMTQHVTDVSDLSSQIATAAEEQSSVTHDLSRNMNAISDIVQELDNNGKEALNDAQSISQINGQLNEIVGRFRL
ncbi:methyl-accepting chemotaxis protein [Vibrio sp. SCSIO 43136]|uniref:methyl-accepting chemotaxis protein n=1 Tax=Vibrio sp. SCSIO 43136 TaxID=2819101 RepID=UPI0020751D7C|nr:methyl-accepting chemotaxis protein [Vibrio sp. SCSIO 43136]USD68172.1 methyl-accepting chemotaxis protein [Vibrio sp. SCSIO 43136]